MGNFYTNTAEFNESWRRLSQRWETIKTQWNDSVRRKLEHAFWQHLDHQTKKTLYDMEQLAHVVEQARKSVK